MYNCICIKDEPKFPFNRSDIKGIGRYERIHENKTYVCDVIFNRLVSTSWNFSEKDEYLFGDNGYYRNWTYDIHSKSMRDIVMEWINLIPYEKRTYRNVIRHLMRYMSSDLENNNGLIVAKWSGVYNDNGKPPSYWTNSQSIFEERKKQNKPVKYGQCWCFAECMTTVCRFLGIACRTICGKNTLIDENLDNGIDFKEDLRKSESDNKYLLLTKDSLSESLTNLSNGVVNKSEPWDELLIYDSGDSYWNIHYWNEIWIPSSTNSLGEWEIIDSTPLNKKVLGPSKVSDISSRSIETSVENYDFTKLFSMVNAPYRLWTIETIVENDRIISIPFVYSIIYPLNEKLSVYIKRPSIIKLFSFSPSLSTRKHGSKKLISEDITSTYKSCSLKLKDIYFKDINLDSLFYIQTVYLDLAGNVLNVNRTYSKIENMVDVSVTGSYIISYLLVEMTEISDKRKWISFLEYAR